MGRCQRGPRCERQMQFAEPAQDIGRLEGVATLVGRSVLDFTDIDFRHPVQDALDRNTAFDAGQRSAGARMHAASESHVLANVLAVEPKFVRIVKPAGITVGGAGQHHHDRADGNVDATDGGRPACQPAVTFDGALHAQRFLDELGNQAAVLANSFLDVGPVAEHLQGSREQLGGGLLAGREQEGRRMDSPR